MAFNRVSYKQTCILCRKNKVLISSYKQKPICSECGTREFKEVTEEPFKTLFAIPPELYSESSFLRSIRSNYHRYGSLSEKQVEVFKRVAKEMQENRNAPAKTSLGSELHAISVKEMIGNSGGSSNARDETPAEKPAEKKSVSPKKASPEKKKTVKIPAKKPAKKSAGKKPSKKR